MQNAESLFALIERYSVAQGINKDSAAQLRYSARALERFLDREPVLSDLNSDTLNRLIVWRLEAGFAAKTVHGQRRSLLTIARAFLAEVPKVRRVRVPAPIPVTWWPAEFVKIMGGIDQLHGGFACGVPRRLMLRAMALTAYYTALRPGDLILIPSSCLHASGRFVYRPTKTGVPLDLTLPADCLEAILATRPERRRLLFPIGRNGLCRWIKKVREQVGLDGTAKWFRRLGATQAHIQQPGSAMLLLGHRTPGLDHKHYIDARQVQTNRPIPPPLAG